MSELTDVGAGYENNGGESYAEKRHKRDGRTISALLSEKRALEQELDAQAAKTRKLRLVLREIASSVECCPICSEYPHRSDCGLNAVLK